MCVRDARSGTLDERGMRRKAFPAILATALSPLLAQTGAEPSPAERGAELAEQGQCAEAVPLIRQSMDRETDSNLKRRIGVDGVRCAMMADQEGDATAFLAWLEREFPRDPDILFLAAHVHWDLFLRSQQALIAAAPDSPLVVQLNAEGFERQGAWKQAIDEYRILLKRAPDTPGIHYRIGRLLQELPPTPASAADEQKEFEAELQVFPQNAMAEYSLGELARRANHLAPAIEHFRRAIELNASLGDAYYGLGKSLLDSDHASDAVAPLEMAERLEPDNPTVHFGLATAYQRAGRKDDAVREFRLQKDAAEKIQQTTNAVRRGIAGEAPETGAR